ncbi:MAG: archease [Candidatus Pacearchaeota archaeon]
MVKYIFLPHTADAKFQAYGKTLEEAFANAAYAMTDIIVDQRKVKSKIKEKIVVKSEDEESLLYDFLEKFLILLDTKGFILSKINNLKIKKSGKALTLTASLSGDNCKDYQTKTTIKAVTYQEMFIKKEKNKVIVQVIVDI